jgi:3-phenylpropionate/trans-cinnamate dioxygenase ferredoxin reductase subunit
MKRGLGMDSGVVIIGAGQGGFQVAASLRMGGYRGTITLIGEEPHLPYQRPPLSKEYLLGKQAIEKTELRPRMFYEAQNIALMMGERVVEVDRGNQQVRLASGQSIAYSKLVLATGARVRKLPDGLIDGALYLRGRDTAIELKRHIDNARTVVIVGGGFIGLEVAAAARALGKKVTVVEMQPRLMARVVAPVISKFYRELHTEQGVEIRLGAQEIPDSDLVVAGIGVIPNDELARDAGLTAANGIAVDSYMRTSDQNIYAIGDCAEHDNPYAGDRVRLESVQNAVDQGKCAALNIIASNAGGSESQDQTQGQIYDAVPWFWTHQFDIMLQMAGLSAGCDQVVTRGDPGSRKFSVFYFREGKLRAVDSINRPADHMLARKLLAAKTCVTPDQVADESLDLKDLVRAP